MVSPKTHIVLLAAIGLCVEVGCDKPLSRPALSAAEFRARYLRRFNQSQVETVNYVYDGTIGGERVIGRITFRRHVSIQIKKDTGEMGSYDPARLTEPERQEFQQRWDFGSRGKAPAWFDFPFDRKMNTIRETRSKPDAPPYERTWYIDTERNIVYLLAVED